MSGVNLKKREILLFHGLKIEMNINITIEKFSLGKSAFKNIKGGIASIENTTQLRQGNIGNLFLKQFKVSFDYVNKEIIFESNER